MSGSVAAPESSVETLERVKHVRRRTIAGFENTISRDISMTDLVQRKNNAVRSLELSLQSLGSSVYVMGDRSEVYLNDLLFVIAHIHTIRKRTIRSTSCVVVAREDTPATTECAVCGENLSTGSVFMTPCNHYYHMSCMSKWITTGHSTCPICRSGVMREQIPMDAHVVYAPDEVKTRIRTMWQELHPLHNAGSS
jgi:hypothetical protein